jgi:hypothetical protein
VSEKDARCCLLSPLAALTADPSASRCPTHSSSRKRPKSDADSSLLCLCSVSVCLFSSDLRLSFLRVSLGLFGVLWLLLHSVLSLASLHCYNSSHTTDRMPSQPNPALGLDPKAVEEQMQRPVIVDANGQGDITAIAAAPGVTATTSDYGNAAAASASADAGDFDVDFPTNLPQSASSAATDAVSAARASPDALDKFCQANVNALPASKVTSASSHANGSAYAGASSSASSSGSSPAARNATPPALPNHAQRTAGRGAVSASHPLAANSSSSSNSTPSKSSGVAVSTTVYHPLHPRKGQLVDAQDCANQWLRGRITAVTHNKLRVNFTGWTDKYDEWYPRGSAKVS